MKASPNNVVVPRRINYLHYGDALEQLQVIREYSTLRQIPKKTVVARLNGSVRSKEYASYIIERYGSRKRKTIDVAHALADLETSIRTRRHFRALRSRGFSYDFSTRPTGFPVRFRKHINVRAAIFADTRLHYPPAVLKFLSYTRRCHFYDYYGPAIAFLLAILRGRDLYIVTLQSDPSFNVPSAVKEHFRGWRRILLNLTMTHYQPRRAYLVQSEDVLRACYQGSNVPAKVPVSWQHIYEQSAKESGKKIMTLERGLNIQLYARHPKVIAKRFYVLK